MPQILLADDHALVRRGMRQLLEEHPGWRVCAEATNGREAVGLATQLRPAVAVLDLSMPELNGLEATREIRRTLPATEVLVYTVHHSEEVVREVLAAGARGYILKADAPQDLVAAVDALLRHTPFFTRRVAESVLSRFLTERDEGGAPRSVLTPRERQVVQLIAEGKRNRRISSLLGVSVKTVETHRTAIMRKLGINSVVDLVRFAIRNGIVEP